MKSRALPRWLRPALVRRRKDENISGPSELQPHFFVEVPEALPREKGSASGDMVRVRSARGAVEGRAMVTKRMRGCPKRSLHPAALELT